MQVLHPDIAVDDNFIIAGPLNLNKRMMRADTVMGERLQLSPLQFRTLLMLVSNEGVPIPFEELHMFMTMPEDEKCSIQTARDVIISLVNIVNVSGRGFAKINILPNDEYIFATKWGMDWRVSDEVFKVSTKRRTDAVAPESSDKLSKIVLSIAMVVALLVFIASYFAFSSSSDGLVYVPVLQIPLAGMQAQNRTVMFPYIRNDAFYTYNNYLYVDTINLYDGDILFMLSLNMADGGIPISRSILVPRGEASNEIFLFRLLEPGRHTAEFELRAFCAELLTEVESKSIQIAIYLD